MKPSTTFLIGRKGTGKSTIFQRAQAELRRSDDVASAYVDIKTVYESSQTDPGLTEALPADAALPRPALEKLLLYRAFIRALVIEIKEETKKRLKESFWERIKNDFSGSVDELFESLDDLLREAESNTFTSVLGVKRVVVHQKAGEKISSSSEASLTADAAAPALKVTLSDQISRGSEASEEMEYADVLMRVFNVKQILSKLRAILSTAKIRHLYVFIDDFSELPLDAMVIVVDSLLAPLNNWSDETIKFKVAAYPGRIHYGNIDKTKIDEVYLDLYKLYGTSDVADMEEKAIDFTRRLTERRLQHYCGSGLETFTDKDDPDIWRLLFYASMANPRNLGHILHNLYQTNLIYDSVIGNRAIRNAAQSFYEDKVAPYFSMTKFIHESYSERSSIFSLKELLEEIVQRARDLRKHRESTVMKELTGVPPTSHFHVAASLETLLNTLELNFFVTKYYEMSDRDARKVTVFALNYGLCQKWPITFGRPTERREHRLYFVERVFDYTPILQSFMNKNQEIRCNGCGERFGVEKLDALKTYDMLCPRCKTGICEVINLSRKYESLIRSVDPKLLLPYTEMGILQTLHSENRTMVAAEIASEMDRSYQLVGRRGKNLAERGLVDRTENDQGRRVFSLTSLADKSYFGQTKESDLNLQPE